MHLDVVAIAHVFLSRFHRERISRFFFPAPTHPRTYTSFLWTPFHLCPFALLDSTPFHLTPSLQSTSWTDTPGRDARVRTIPRIPCFTSSGRRRVQRARGTRRCRPCWDSQTTTSHAGSMRPEDWPVTVAVVDWLRQRSTGRICLLCRP